MNLEMELLTKEGLAAKNNNKQLGLKQPLMKGETQKDDLLNRLTENDSSNKIPQSQLRINGVNFKLPEDVQEEGVVNDMEAYKESESKLILSYILFALTGGLLYLFTRWNLNLKIRLQMIPCKQTEAQYMKIISLDNVITLEKTYKTMMNMDQTLVKEYLTFDYRLYKYYYDELKDAFFPIQFALSVLTNNQIHEKYGSGVTSEEQLNQLKSIFGENNTEIPDKSGVKILIDEVLSPFYLFQVFSVVLWILEPYYYYASVIFVTSVLSAGTNLVEAMSNYKKLRQMSFFETPVFAYRGISEYLSLVNNNGFLERKKDRGHLKIEEDVVKGKKNVSSLNLVPGDIIEIPDGQIMPCDVILLNGSCVMNESMLTGESIPVIKSSLPYNSNKYNPNEDGKQSTLFAGTKCIETRYYLKGKIPVLGLVSQTSFNTMKGQLVRSILYPKTSTFSFYADSLRFIAVLAIISLLGFFVSLPFMIEGLDDGFLEIRDLILNSLDLVTITVPPALPTCLSIGISFAMSRLKKQQIFCISPPKVNICGKVTIMCFDKTGTLTEEGLDMYGLRPVFYTGPKRVRFQKLQEDTRMLGATKRYKNNGIAEQQAIYGEHNPYSLIGDPEVILKECMASCHGLTRIRGELIGDPLEVKMFEATEWVLIENDIDKYDELVLAVVQPPQTNVFKGDVEDIERSIVQNELPSSIGIIKRFEFSSKLQRMSTIVRNLQNETDFFRLHVKGSPEKIFELCLPETIPQNFHEVLDFYARKGFRVLAFGVRVLKMTYRKIQKVERDEIEKELSFAGLLIMENKLKPITTEIIEELQEANIRTIMVTGDNALTAISVGRQCQIIHESMRVYFGDISEDNSNGTKGKIVWKDFEMGNKVLDEDNLEPVNGVAEYHEENIPEIQDEKQILEQAHQLEEEDKQAYRSSVRGQSMIKNRQSYIEQARRQSISYQDHLPEAGQEFEKNNLVKGERAISSKLDRAPSSGDRKNANFQESSVSSEGGHDKISECEKIDEVDEGNYDNAEEILPWTHNEHFSLAITGKAFSKIISEASKGKRNAQLLRTMLLKTQIFARMKPEEKALLLLQLQDLPWKPTCGMCGDGANDCGALKSADIGISLSEAEASIAAPFTSKIQDISCVIELLKEGRAALVTSFSCFKFMALYSMIQFFTTTLLYTVNSVPGDFQFLFWDVAIIIPLAFLMGLTQAYPKLSKQVPGSSLVSFPVLCSVIGQTLINGGFQCIVFYTLTSMSWYMSVKDAHTYLGDVDDEDARKTCYESTTLFFFTNFQYIASCLAFSIGKPFKKSFFTNIPFTVALILITALSLYVMLIPDSFTKSFLSIFEKVQLDDDKPISTMPYYWLLILLGFTAVNLFVSMAFEKFGIRALLSIYKKRKDKKKVQNGAIDEVHMSVVKQ